jgi:hypothetical protein
VGAEIAVSTLIAVRAAESRWLVLGGPLVLALAVASADVLASGLRGESSGPSWAAVLLGGSILLAGLIVARRDDPGIVKTLIPVIGVAAWVTLLLRPESRRKTCKGI